MNALEELGQSLVPIIDVNPFRKREPVNDNVNGRASEDIAIHKRYNDVVTCVVFWDSLVGPVGSAKG